MTGAFLRILKKKTEAGLTWDELAAKAGIRLKSWMCGVCGEPDDNEIRKIAAALNVSFGWLKNGDLPAH